MGSPQPIKLPTVITKDSTVKLFSALRKNSILLLGIACLSMTGVAHSEETSVVDVAQVFELLTDAGYQQISEIELSDNRKVYEIEAVSSEYEKVDIEVDAIRGTIINVKVDND